MQNQHMQRWRIIGVIVALAVAQAICIYLAISVREDRLIGWLDFNIKNHSLILLPLAITVAVEIYHLFTITRYDLTGNIFRSILLICKTIFIVVGFGLLLTLLEYVLPTTSTLYQWLYGTGENLVFSFIAEVLYVGLILLPLYIYLTPTPTNE